LPAQATHCCEPNRQHDGWVGDDIPLIIEFEAIRK
jgi:hypothetical protein